MSLDVGGCIKWPGKLEIHYSPKPLYRSMRAKAEAYTRVADCPVVVLELNGHDEVVTYLYNDKWVKPSKRMTLMDAVKSVIEHKKVDVKVPDFFTMFVTFGNSPGDCAIH